MENNPDELIRRVVEDFPEAKPRWDGYQSLGIKDNLPVFTDRTLWRMNFPLSWLSGGYKDFHAWRKAAQAKIRDCLLKAPPAAPFMQTVIAEQERGSYTARKVIFNLTGDSRVLAYMLIPKGKGPFPTVLLLHDHGAKLDIGKEKVIQPFEDKSEHIESAQTWVEKYYGGRFIGDELAKRGYVCFATDALNWSDRGGAGQEGQQALASNLLHMGMSLAGVIAHEDLRTAEFLASQPEVDARRIAAMGLSMGSFRAWQLAALSEQVNAGVAICWMGTVKGLMTKGNNQTFGLSAYTMTHPGLFNYLDYPDIASVACPKPMLFFNGKQDALFPVSCVEEAYTKMHKVWKSQNADEQLVTKLWDVPHVFNVDMQEEAFAWLEQQLCSP
jgi:dienelactone hydrolase